MGAGRGKLFQPSLVETVNRDEASAPGAASTVAITRRHRLPERPLGPFQQIAFSWLPTSSFLLQSSVRLHALSPIPPYDFGDIVDRRRGGENTRMSSRVPAFSDAG